MIATISTSSVDGADELRNLHTELLADPAWRGQVDLVESPAQPGTLGPVLDALQVALQPGTVGALTAALAAYLRWRTKDIELTIRRTDGNVEIVMSAKRLRDLDHEALTAEIARLTERLEAQDRDGDDRRS